jgi:metal-responsive CopG/Arc/MetJ family transcriptional regulator
MKIKIDVTIEKGIVEEVDRFAKKHGLNRSQTVQNMLSVSLADVKIINTLGLLDMAEMVMKVQERLKLNLAKA